MTDERVKQLQDEILKMPQAEGSVRHIFMPGIYMRELTIPAGVVSVGHNHRYNHISMLTKGRITVLNNDGSLTELVAPFTMISSPGKKCAYSHDEVVWVNIHAAPCTDVETMEQLLYDWSDAPDRIKELPDNTSSDDYQQMLIEWGLTEDDVQAETQVDNVAPMPYGIHKCKVSDSKLHGKGVFATANISDGELIAPVFMDGLRTPIGRYMNHSGNPNAVVIKAPNGDNYLMATRNIQGCMGGNDGEEITTNYRETLRLLGRTPCQVG